MSIFRDMMKAGLGIIHDAASQPVTYRVAATEVESTVYVIPRTIRPELRAAYDQDTLARSKLWEVTTKEFRENVEDNPAIGDVIIETLNEDILYWEVVADPITGHCFAPVGGGADGIRIFTLQKLE